MNQILRFLITYCSFLYRPDGFRFVDSYTASSFGGDAFVVLASDQLRLRFVRDRGQLFLDFQGSSQQDKNNWFSIDVVQQLVVGEEQDSAEITAQRVKFVEERIEEISSRFSGDQLEDTQVALKSLERARAKKLFG
jgi:hypothetical protein